MKTRILLAALLIIGTVFLRGDGCIMKDKVIEIVVFAETSAVIEQDEDNATFTNDVLVDFDTDIDAALEDAGYSRDDIISAEFQGGHYGGLTKDDHDWVVSGEIWAQREGVGGQVTAINYTSQSVDAALGQKIPAPVEAAAVDLINAALDDYLAGQSGIQLRFGINNGSTNPTPSTTDRMEFDWKVWMTMTVILSDEAEWPDPF